MKSKKDWDDSQIGGDRYFRSLFNTQASRNHTGIDDGRRKEASSGPAPIGLILARGYAMISDDEVLTASEQLEAGRWRRNNQIR